jgi:hypothetical protein
MRTMQEVSSAVLNDARIREALLQRLASQAVRPRAIAQELHVHNGSAIADVVALHSEAHCYEIKGATDRIDRIVTQAAFYNAVFRRITLVGTECNLRRALLLIPPFWGVMIAMSAGASIRFRHIRAARLNPHFEKRSAALTLWKKEMLELLPEVGTDRMPRRRLAELIAHAQSESELSKNICDFLVSRASTAHAEALPTV